MTRIRPRSRRGSVVGSRAGLTLIELLMVLTILAALAGVMAATFSGGISITGKDGVERSQEELVTISTMQAVRDALVGTGVNDPGYLQDIGNLPSRVSGLIINLDNENLFDPATKRGWRGPYISPGGTQYGEYLAADDNFPDNDDIAGIEAEPGILDGWRKPLYLIVEIVDEGTANEIDYSRIVSAGPPDSDQDAYPSPQIDSPFAMPAAANTFDRGNDIVLFLFAADPNPPDPTP